eukprot:Hpha_TRINITY_DN34911_c0_g1::TRINITY_DN34911_c0_g1_i1::g.184087::m.184087
MENSLQATANVLRGRVGAKEHVLPTAWEDARGEAWRRSDKVLGKGCFGVVWLGMSEDGNLCAVKALEVSGQKSKKEVESTLNEVHLMLKLRHNNIVCYLSSSVSRGHLLICLEYVPGGSLEGIMSTFNRLAVSTVQRYAKGIVEGLVYLHSHKVAHRDFKPANVLLQIEGLCKLSDFGASSELRKVGGKEVVGTPLYMSPEACAGEAALPADIWSFGVTLYQMLTQQLPYGPAQLSMGPVGFMYGLGRGSFLPTLKDDLVLEAADLLAGCFNPEPKGRPTARAVLDDAFFFYSRA